MSQPNPSLSVNNLVDREILIVEDSASSLTLLTDVMREAGYVVRQAQDGELALISVQQKYPDLILLDVKMPRIDGYEVCQRLKANKETENIPIIFLSALDENDAKLQGLKLGAVDYISKPYEAEEVLLRVRTHLELRNLQLKLEDMCELRTQQLHSEVEERRQAEKELFESRQKLRDLSNHLEDVREAERTRIAREIHDELGQALTVARIDLTRLSEALDQPKSKLKTDIAAINAMLEQAADIARSISENLRPGMLDLLGLQAALEHHIDRFAQTTAIKCSTNIVDKGNLDSDTKITTTVFRIVQEALTNVARHAAAREVSVQVVDTSTHILAIIQDDGKGIEKGPRTHRYGLLGMGERVHALGGNLTIESEPGKGARIEATLPFKMDNK